MTVGTKGSYVQTRQPGAPDLRTVTVIRSSGAPVVGDFVHNAESEVDGHIPPADGSKRAPPGRGLINFWATPLPLTFAGSKFLIP